ncbi:hypothetical protein [Desulfovibrio sp. ZJ200]|uniref:hypothetical protein n=1 Tax=Desulfovibrio sp. ZJ200 TaxID=2709792 RepID=UPI001F150B03|nr:hypothetical protein [Desulfovibrio sp. ZJ200]
MQSALLHNALTTSAPPAFLLSELGVCATLSPMLDQQKISLGRVRQAYRLTSNEVETVIQALWPHAVFPAELWRRAHEAYWKDFADSNQTIYNRESPALPQPCLSDKHFHSYLFAQDMQDFFRKLSENIHAHALELGLQYILEETYDEIDNVFPEERECLFHALKRLETEDFSDQYAPDSPLFETPIFTIPVSSYHFISHIFVDTILVNRDEVIRFLSKYPLHMEVKGITHALVESILKSMPPETASLGSPKVQTEQPTVEETEDGRLTFKIPSAVWRGKPDHAVRDAMKDTCPLAVIAYVLFYWCGSDKPEAGHKTQMGRKTQLGRLLTEKEYSDPKSYRNLMNALLEEADAYTIVKA